MTRARQYLILIPLAMSAVLVVTVLASYSTAREVQFSLARGQGDFTLDSIRRLPDPGPQELEALLQDFSGEGLRCIAVFEPSGPLRAAVGDCSSRDEKVLRDALREARSDEVIDLGGRLRMVRGSLEPEPPSRPPVMVEFEPLMTRELHRAALRSVGIGGAASLALVVVAIGLWRLSLREARLEETVQRDRRLASLGEMAAVMAHEIRNPLASMKGHAQLLAERLEAGSREHEKAQRVVREVVRLEELTSDLLEFVRSQQIERHAVDPTEVLRAAARDVGEDRVELDCREAPREWSLDARLMQQALTNLLRNALEVACDGEKAGASACSENGELVFRVRDHGPGVPETERERIFEPFYTTRLQGTGLGLAVARRIVTLHGGEISISNHPAGGAVARVTIPAG